MHSLKTRITIFTVCMIAITVAIITTLSVVFISNTGHRKSDQMLLLLCETGEKNLDYYFNSVEKSVEKTAEFVESDLTGLADEELGAHIERVGKYFEELAYKTNGVLTYYYRIDPEVSKKEKGFWYTNLDGEGFVPHEVTDITLYDTNDTSSLVWFTVPKYTGESIWLPPYITDNLDVRVISYNVPIYYEDVFVGVVGIEVDYTTMAEQVDSIRLYNNGYAFINDAEGNLIYHPRIDVTQLTDETMPETPEGLISSNTFVQYEFDGVERRAAWLELTNGMRLNVSVPISETSGDWQKLFLEIIIASAIVLIVMSILTMLYTGRISRPLEDLIKAAEEVDNGSYSYSLTYDQDDEVGRLTRTFRKLAEHMKNHIDDLNKRAYVDALTSVRNKGAYSDYIDKLQNQFDEEGEKMEFAIGVFDCNDLKTVNDRYGHEKGDIYLKTASRLICKVFQHSPVFRIGGDEFSVILQNEDYQNRDVLVEQFEQKSAEISVTTANMWEQVNVALGIAVYDPEIDRAVIDVARRADKNMYENKRLQKEKKAHDPSA